MNQEKLQTFFFLSLLIGISVLVAYVFLPYVGVIIVSATMAIILRPLHRRILSSIPTHESLASLATVLAALLIIFVQEKISRFAPSAALDADQALKQLLGWIISKLGVVFSEVTGFIFGFALSMLTMYYLLKDGKKLENILITLSPLKDSDDRDIFSKLKQAVHSVIWGTLVVALTQGVLITTGFYF